MNFKKLLLPLLCVALLSCKKDKTETTPIEKLDTPTFHTMDSDVNQGQYDGFVFSSLSVVKYPNSDSTEIDFSVLAQTNEIGEVIGAFLNSNQNDYSFALTDSFSDKESAQTFFDNYTSSTDTLFDQFALEIKANQIWTIKTTDDKKGKILVTNVRAENRNNSPFVEIKFQADKLN